MALKYVPYYPNSLKGQALLDNFVRTKRVLRYRDNNQVVERIMNGMPLYEMELTEKIGEDEEDNLVFRPFHRNGDGFQCTNRTSGA